MKSDEDENLQCQRGWGVGPGTRKRKCYEGEILKSACVAVLVELDIVQKLFRITKTVRMTLNLIDS